MRSIVNPESLVPSLLSDLLRFRYDEICPNALRVKAAKRMVVLLSGQNPTFDYYIAPRLGGIETQLIDIRSQTPGTFEPRPGDYVLICRYLTGRWARHIAEARDLAGIGLFFDDDLVAFIGDSSIPLLYRLDVARRTILPLRNARPALTDIIVSTVALQQRYSRSKARVLGPVPAEDDITPRPRASAEPFRIAFHAQLSHLADHAFAARIFAQMQGRVEIDVMGPAQSKRAWDRVPGVRFHAEVDWPAYKRRSKQLGADLLVAPMLDTPLNQARSSTKAIDAVRMGAAAIFPRMAAYRGLDGSATLIDGGIREWVSTIRSYVEDRARTHSAAEKLRAEITRWRDKPSPLIRGLECSD